MKIIFAQGNPGKAYEHTRHNIGFFLVDELAKNHGAEFANKPKFHAEIAEFATEGEKVLLAKPTTFYNETGTSARALADFYKCAPSTDMLVIHDELALPFGTLRTREKGRDAGNNGIKSLNAHLGPDYLRLRVGVYNEKRDRLADTDFVLGKFTPEEKAALPKIRQATEKITDDFIRGTFEPTKITVTTKE